MALYEIKEEKERVILVGVSTRENDDTEDSLDDLKDLVKTAGAEAVGRVGDVGHRNAVDWNQGRDAAANIHKTAERFQMGNTCGDDVSGVKMTDRFF